MPIPSNAVWEVRQGGSSTNGGFYVTGSSGTDYSQQISAQYNLTGLTTSGVGAVINTSAASDDMVGNGIRIQSGTNFTTGWYQIVSVDPGVSITVDRNCCTNAASSGVGNIGGALDRMGSAGGTYVAGNYVWVKGTIVCTSNESVSATGTAALPIIIRGYNSVRGDGYFGQDLITKELFTTNFADVSFTGNFGFSVSTHTYVENIKVTGSRSSYLLNATSGTVRNCWVENSSSTSSAGGINAAIVFNCDVKMTGNYSDGSPTGAAFLITTGYGLACRATCPAHQVPAYSLAGANRQSALINAIAYNCLGNGLVTGTSTSAYVQNCLFYSCAVDGIAVSSTSSTATWVLACMFVNCGEYGIECGSSSAAVVVQNCYFRNNTLGNINQGNSLLTEFTLSNVYNTGTDDSVDFVNAAAGDFTLVPTSSAVGLGLTTNANPGPFQNPVNSGGGGQFSFARVI